MINILIPSCGDSEFFKESYYPKTLYEVKGQPMIQQVVDNYATLENKHFIFLFLQQECDKFHTDAVVSLLTHGEGDTICLKNVTEGALCSCLMAIDYIDTKNELIITNNDQIIDVDFISILTEFRRKEVECGLICFRSLHPRWSYIRTNEINEVIEAAEKRPISDKAIAGFYYFKRGDDFVKAAKSAIKKDRRYNGKYYLTAAINEMILNGKKVSYYQIKNETYYSFYTPDRVRLYENGEKI